MKLLFCRSIWRAGLQLVAWLSATSAWSRSYREDFIVEPETNRKRKIRKREAEGIEKEEERDRKEMIYLV